MEFLFVRLYKELGLCHRGILDTINYLNVSIQKATNRNRQNSFIKSYARIQAGRQHSEQYL